MLGPGTAKSSRQSKRNYRGSLTRVPSLPYRFFCSLETANTNLIYLCRCSSCSFATMRLSQRKLAMPLCPGFLAFSTIRLALLAAFLVDIQQKSTFCECYIALSESQIVFVFTINNGKSIQKGCLNNSCNSDVQDGGSIGIEQNVSDIVLSTIGISLLRYSRHGMN